MALLKVRLSSWDQEADTSLYEIDVVGERPDEIVHAGRWFRFHNVEVMTRRGVSFERLVYTDVTPRG